MIIILLNAVRCVLDRREDSRLNEEAIACLISAGHINVSTFDSTLNTMMDTGLNYSAVNFAMKLVQKLIVDDKGSNLVTESDMPSTIDTLAKLCSMSRQAPER